MSRPLRLDYPGALHHVTLRTNFQRPLFACQRCRAAVFRILADCHQRFSTRFHAYAVMDNHVHLAVTSTDGRLARTMQYFGAALTRTMNHHHGRTGHVFQGRYFNRLVEDPAYQQHLLAYIHLNPDRAGKPGAVWSDTWTSHRAYLSGKGPDWLDRGRFLECFGGSRPIREYIDLVRSGRLAPPVGFEEQVLLHPRSSDRMTMPEAEDPAPADLQSLLTAIAHETGTTTLCNRMPRSRRDVLLLWLTRAGVRQRALADHLDVHPSTVSRAVQRGTERARTGAGRDLLDRLDAAMRASMSSAA